MSAEKDKGAALNERVWKLFERAGFETKPSSNDPFEESVELSPRQTRTVDLSAVDKKLGVKIIGWNKARRELKESLTVHIHDYKELQKKATANSVLFVSTGKEVSPTHKRYAEEQGMRVWGEEELRYYEAVVDAIGIYAKYEMIHSFGIETQEEKSIHPVFALRFHQPHSNSETNLFLFTIPPEKLLRTCVIFRRAQGSGDTYQRMVRKDRLQRFKKFITQPNEILPPNIIVNFTERANWRPLKISPTYENGQPIVLARAKDCELGVLSIPMKYASLELIDGQHRLYGFVGTEPATKENFNLVVLGLECLPFDKRRGTFVAINDNSRRVDPNLVAFLKYTDVETECQKDPELMAIKIVVELNKSDPFKKRIRLLDIGKQRVTLKGFSGYDLKSVIGPRGLLRKFYPENQSTKYISALRMYFGVLKSLFEEEWKAPEKYIIFRNKGISAFLKLLKSILKTCKATKTTFCRAVVNKYLGALKDNWKGGWDMDSLKKSYVGSQGWKDFHRDLIRAIRKKYRKFKE